MKKIYAVLLMLLAFNLYAVTPFLGKITGLGLVNYEEGYCVIEAGYKYGFISPLKECENRLAEFIMFYDRKVDVYVDISVLEIIEELPSIFLEYNSDLSYFLLTDINGIELYSGK